MKILKILKYRHCEHSKNVWQSSQFKIKQFNHYCERNVTIPKILILTLSFLLFSFSSAYAQNQAKIDSLNQVLKTTTQDTVKIKTLLEIGDQYEYPAPDTALIFYQKALKLAQKIKEQKFIVKCFNYIGLVYVLQKGNFTKALKYFQKALKINKKLGDKREIASNFGNIGLVYDYQSNYPKALKYYQRALKIDEKLDDKNNIANNLGNIGNVYIEQSNYSKALEYYKKALFINKELKHKYEIAKVLGDIGLVYFYQSNYPKALKYYQRALKINKKLGSKYEMAINLGNIGNLYANQSNYPKALEYLQKAFKINIKLNAKNGIAINLVNIGTLYNNLEQYNRALEYINKALIISKEIGELLLSRDIYEDLSIAYKGLNNYKKALEYKDKWIALNDSIFNTEKAKSIAEMNTKYETEKKEKQIIQQQAELKTSQLEAEKEKAEKEKQQTQRNMFIVAFGLMLILAGFVFRSYRQKQKANILLAEQKEQITEANEELNQQNEEIIAQRDEIEQQRNTVVQQKERIEEIHHEVSESINYATRLQEAILPEEKILEKYISEHFILFKPKDKVSGDFYWWTHIENHTVITAADSTGHGVPGAFMSMLGSSFLREIVQKEYITHTGVILRKLRKEIIKALKQTGEAGTQKDGMDMALISIDHETNMVQFSGANNPLYIIKNGELEITNESRSFIKEFVILNEAKRSEKSLDNQSRSFAKAQDDNSKLLYEVKPDKMPIAIYEKMDAFTTHEIQLEKGDMLYMFSDGYADQFGGPKGKKFKYKAFKRLLLENAHKSMEEQKEILNQAFEDWKGQEEQIDDVVVVGIRI